MMDDKNAHRPTIFDFEGHKIRCGLDKDGVPYFEVTDVKKALGCSSTLGTTTYLDDYEHSLMFLRGPDGDKTQFVVNEMGIYSLLHELKRHLKPKKGNETLQKFRIWITNVVLPALRASIPRYDRIPLDPTMTMTLPDYCDHQGIDHDKDKLTAIGKILNQKCRDQGITLTTVPDNNYGIVNVYPIPILEQWHAEESAS